MRGIEVLSSLSQIRRIKAIELLANKNPIVGNRVAYGSSSNPIVGNRVAYIVVLKHSEDHLLL